MASLPQSKRSSPLKRSTHIVIQQCCFVISVGIKRSCRGTSCETQHPQPPSERFNLHPYRRQQDFYQLTISFQRINMCIIDEALHPICIQCTRLCVFLDQCFKMKSTHKQICYLIFLTKIAAVVSFSELCQASLTQIQLCQRSDC